MSDRFKYSLNGVYRYENFEQYSANRSTRENIGSAGGTDNWTINLRIHRTNEAIVYPRIQCNVNIGKLGIKGLLYVLRKDETTSFLLWKSVQLAKGRGFRGIRMGSYNLLNEKKGYLDNGALRIGYGIQVESILLDDNIWRFNTKDPVFECEEKKNMISLVGPNSTDIYVHKQLLTFHSPYFNRNCTREMGNFKELIDENDWFEDLESFLQIAHGVQLKHSENSNLDLGRILSFAYSYSFKNVIRYCERQFIENDMIIGHTKQWVIHWDGMRHYLVHLLKYVKSPRQLIDEDDIGKMKGETMKMIVAKFFNEQF